MLKAFLSMGSPLLMSLLGLLCMNNVSSLLVVLPRTKLLHLYEAEVLTAFGSNEAEVNAEKLDSGVWTLSSSEKKVEQVLSRLSGCEAVYEDLTDLCRTPESLLEEVERLGLTFERKFDLRVVQAHPYARNQRGFSGPQHQQRDRQINSRMLCVAVGQRIRGIPAFEKVDEDEDAPEALSLIECGRGFVLARERSLPAPSEGDWVSLKTKFKRRPFSFSAALNPDIARSVLHTITAMHDVNDSSDGLCILDPCVGSGTTAFVATMGSQWGMVSRIVGCDVNDGFVSQAAANLAYMDGTDGVEFFTQDATKPLPEGESASADRVNADLIVANLPWGENKAITYHEDTHRIIETLGSAAGTYHYRANHGACAAFITNQASRIPSAVYKNAGWAVEQVVAVRTGDKHKASDIVVTFARLEGQSDQS